MEKIMLSVGTNVQEIAFLKILRNFLHNRRLFFRQEKKKDKVFLEKKMPFPICRLIRRQG